MKEPRMILFDYGQTLVKQRPFDGVKGTEAVLKFATKNQYAKTAEEVQAFADELNRELGGLIRKSATCSRWKCPITCLPNTYMNPRGLKLR